MAYMTKEGHVPYPNKEGEWYSNFYIDNEPLTMENETVEEARKSQEEFLARFRWGRPRPTTEGTTEELEEMRLVGLYLREDHAVPEGDTEIETPEWMKEPLGPGMCRD